MPGKSHGPRSLMGYRTWHGVVKSQTWLSNFTFTESDGGSSGICYSELLRHLCGSWWNRWLAWTWATTALVPPVPGGCIGTRRCIFSLLLPWGPRLPSTSHILLSTLLYFLSGLQTLDLTLETWLVTSNLGTSSLLRWMVILIGQLIDEVPGRAVKPPRKN